MMDIPGSGRLRLRADLSMTVFFSEPGEYDGGELRVLDTYGDRAIKLPAGHAILYTATSLHEVTPVTRGIRTSSFFWIQSLIRDDARRSMLYDLGWRQHIPTTRPSRGFWATITSCCSIGRNCERAGGGLARVGG